MIQSFAGEGTEDIFDGRSTRAARQTCPSTLWPVAFRKLDQLDAADDPEDLLVPPGNRLEALRGGREGQLSIRINQQYRVCVVWTEHGPQNVEIVDYN